MNCRPSYPFVYATCFLMLSNFAAVAQERYPELQRLQGAWVPEGQECKKVFFRQGRSINFHRPGISVREGLLLQGNRLSDGRQRCVISNTKQDQDSYSILITCLGSRSLITSKLSLFVKFEDENSVVRTFNGFPEERLKLRRCPI